jgi:hypothetical protein
VIIPAFVHYIKYVHYQLTFAVFMQTLFFGLAALITPTNINWLMAVQFLAMLPFACKQHWVFVHALPHRLQFHLMYSIFTPHAFQRGN